jgi:hypothetical protein
VCASGFRTVHWPKVEGEHLDGSLVAVAHAGVKEAVVVRVRTLLVGALVIVLGAHRLAKGDLSMLRKVPATMARRDGVQLGMIQGA